LVARYSSSSLFALRFSAPGSFASFPNNKEMLR
jgi:hypothetical protein